MLRRAKSLAEQAADAIRTRIVGGEIPLGAPLSENALAAELGVSKTPVREALLQLKMEGLVSIQPQRGSFVFDMTPEEIAELGELRETLELAALRLANERHRGCLLADLRETLEQMRHAVAADDFAAYRQLDSSYHDLLFRHCDNQYMRDCYRGFAFRVDALRIHLSADLELNRASLQEHVDIVERLEAGDVDAAADRLKAHAQGTIWQYNNTRYRGDVT